MIQSLPSRNKQLIESPFVWLKEKAERDRQRTGVPSKLWYIKGKIYDLSQFLQLHPGGDYFLSLTQGQDITEMYYSHHLNMEKCNAILQKYYVRDADKIDQYFDYDEKGFYLTLHKKVSDYFKTRDKGPTLMMKLVVFIALFSFIITFLLTCTLQSYLWAIICGYTLYVCFGLGHNFLHQGSFEPRRYLADLSFFSHFHWAITHCISHHHFTNSNIDLEVTSFEPYYKTQKSKLPNNKYFRYYMDVFFALVSTIQFLSTIQQLLRGEERIRKEYFIPIVEYLILYYFCGDALEGFKLFMVIQSTSSYLTLKYSLITHHNNICYTDGCSIVPSRDFGIYTLQTSQDHDPQVIFPFNMFIFQGFNQHTLHHMFPTVDESRIPEIQHFLLETIQEFKLQHIYKQRTVGELYKAHNDFVFGK
ncbi:unnamed protein product [Paramecium primaurelia]|uniref:Cytochrome b5 heme-binding domain-containing protein n=1 Tax=Paramecium primaurelia TaxID=5886 RepID=A0A8S1QQE1_PARPR|nr:unnamed protein product [Paramecium primaurelia]CAD8117671.1 unnamed protein product [Paramecium primaurelia]